MRTLLFVAALVACNPPAAPPPPPVEDVVFTSVFARGATTTAPLIVALHGLGDTPANFARAFEDFPATAEIAVPRGVLAHMHGRAWYAWLPDATPEVQVANLREADAKVWPAIVKHAHGRPIIVTGFSQGGVMAYAFAALHPTEVVAAFPVAGRLPSGLWPTKVAARVHALHGVEDQVIPIDDDRRTNAAFAAVNPRCELSEYAETAHDFGAMRDALFEELLDELAR